MTLVHEMMQGKAPQDAVREGTTSERSEWYEVESREYRVESGVSAVRKVKL
jgi:hypothetical protein